MGSRKMCHSMCVKTFGFSTMAHHLIFHLRSEIISTSALSNSGRGGPIGFARSPDLIPIDYYLWDHMKFMIYETPVASKEDLLARVMAEVDVGGPRIDDRVYLNIVRR